MMAKMKVGAVSYLNTKPLIYGFEQGGMKDEITLINDYPSRIAAMLLNDEIDIGLVPVAIIPKLSEAYIIADYCIGCEGPVASVCLFSDGPIEGIKTVLLDYQSRTSVRLAKILLKEYWQIEPELVDAQSDFREHIKGTIAGLVIGDRAFEQRKQSSYAYDLGEAWIKHTGLPFVFAAWVSNKKVTTAFKEQFNKATSAGFSHLDEIVAVADYPLFDLKKYYTDYISYELTNEKRKGMELFLEKVERYKL